MSEEVRAAVIAATLDEVAEHGLAGLAVAAVAERAGTSRATLYRWFPGGRDEVVQATIEAEIERFFTALRARVGDPGDPAERLDALLVEARRLFTDHVVLQRLLADEAGAILPELATLQPLVAAAMAAEVRAVVDAGPRRTGAERATVTEYLTRMVVSYVSSDSPWLADPSRRARLVTRLLSGVSAP